MENLMSIEDIWESAVLSRLGKKATPKVRGRIKQAKDLYIESKKGPAMLHTVELSGKPANKVNVKSEKSSIRGIRFTTAPTKRRK